MRMFAILSATLTSLCGCGFTAEPIPQERIFRVEDLCVPKGRWPAILMIMKDFGSQHSLSFYGGFDDENSTLLNASLIRGHRWVGEDDLNLWVLSDSGKNRISLTALSREKMTSSDASLARHLAALIKEQLGCVEKR